MINQQGKLTYRNKANAFEIFYMAFIICVFIGIIAVIAVFSDTYDNLQISNAIMSLSSLVFVIILFGFCLGGFTWDEKQKKFFEWIIICFYFTCCFRILNVILPFAAKNVQLHFILDNVFYILVSVYWICIWCFQRDKYEFRFKKKYVEIYFFVFFVLYASIAILNMITAFDFAYTANGDVVIKRYHLFYMTVFWFASYMVITIIGKCDKKTKLTFLSYSLFPGLYYILLIFFYDVEVVSNISINIGIIFYLIPLYLLFFNIYMERGKILLMDERELEKSRANVMALQINPHFIANTMSSIVALCDPNAPEAADLASKFAKYLRDNYVNISSEQMIPFSAEMEHVKNYLAVEKVRFPNLKDEYDIKCDNFSVPTLTVQTLVENAVRHGIQKRRNASGTVLIKTYENENNFVVVIKDDGVGIDKTKQKDDKVHIGIQNVTSRLAILCNGVLEIKSKQGVGTTCKVFIPKKSGGGNPFLKRDRI